MKIVLWLVSACLFWITYTNCGFFPFEEVPDYDQDVNDTSNELLHKSMQTMKSWIRSQMMVLENKIDEIDRTTTHRFNVMLYTLFRMVNAEKIQVRKHGEHIKKWSDLIAHLNATLDDTRRIAQDNTNMIKMLLTIIQRTEKGEKGGQFPKGHPGPEVDSNRGRKRG